MRFDGTTNSSALNVHGRIWSSFCNQGRNIFTDPEKCPFLDHSSARHTSTIRRLLVLPSTVDASISRFRFLATPSWTSFEDVEMSEISWRQNSSSSSANSIRLLSWSRFLLHIARESTGFVLEVILRSYMTGPYTFKIGSETSKLNPKARETVRPKGTEGDGNADMLLNGP